MPKKELEERLKLPKARFITPERYKELWEICDYLNDEFRSVGSGDRAVIVNGEIVILRKVIQI